MNGRIGVTKSFPANHILGYYEGQYYQECCSLFNQLVEIDSTYEMVGGVVGICGCILAGTAIRQENTVIKAVECLLSVLSSKSPNVSNQPKSSLIPVEWMSPTLSAVSKVRD